jgi:hypothetical protein
MASSTVLRAGALVASLAALTIGPAGVAGAKDRDDVRVAGRCSGTSTAKLKLSEEHRLIETEFEVDSNRTGQRWHVVLRRNGTVVLNRFAVTRPPSGSFEVRRLLADGPGTETITAWARNVRTGEVCRASATW